MKVFKSNKFHLLCIPTHYLTNTFKEGNLIREIA